jgi:hypothetical protein
VKSSLHSVSSLNRFAAFDYFEFHRGISGAAAMILMGTCGGSHGGILSSGIAGWEQKRDLKLCIGFAFRRKASATLWHGASVEPI